MKRILVVGVIGACSSVYAGERLSNEEMKEFFTDKTLSGVHHKLGPGRSYWGADGNVRSESDSGKVRVGKWWIDESRNLRCLRWNTKNKDFCHYIERNSDGSHTLVHGNKGKKLVEFKGSVPGNQL